MYLTQNNFYATWLFSKIPLKSYLPQEANQFYLNRAPPPKQAIQLLGP